MSKMEDFSMLSFAEQDAIERLIFTGRLGDDTCARRLEDLGLISRVAGGEWFYAGGPISRFFEYAQTKGMKDGIYN